MATDPILDAPRNVHELHRYREIQKATWRIQRVGWWVLVLTGLAGFVGLFGSGPLADTTTRHGAIDVRYEFILRRQSDTTVTFSMPSLGGRATLTLPARYLDAVDISAIQPEPLAAYARDDRQTFVFAAPESRTRVRLTVRPREVGLLHFTPQVNGQPLPTRTPLVLP